MSRRKLKPPLLFDRANSLVGKNVRRPDAFRLIEGRGTYVDDMILPRMVEVCFVRSPFAHARLLSIDCEAALERPGVVAVFTGRDLVEHCTPWKGVLTHMTGMKSAAQPPLAVDRAVWQGEPVVAVVAESRMLAEDAAEDIVIDWEELPLVSDKQQSVAVDAPILHPELGDNICYQRTEDTGDVDQIFEDAHAVVEHSFDIDRQIALPLEPRSILADYNASDRQLTVYLSTQVPHMMQYLFAQHLGLEEGTVRVKVPDMGGGFGAKIHVYGDEMAAAAISIILKRPVKHVLDRLESILADTHSREHRVKVRLAVGKDGEFLAWDVDDLCGAGAYSVYPRGSANESKQIVNLTGGPYASPSYRARARVVFQNKSPLGQYRAVGHPVACLVTEAMVDCAARALAMDPVDIRLRNFIPETAYPYRRPSGVVFERLSQHDCLRGLLGLMDYKALRVEQATLRDRGIFRGIGIAAFVEMSNPSSATYGVGGAPIAALDGCTIRLGSAGSITCAIGATEIGQGALTALAQIAASTLGVAMSDVRVLMGDTDVTPVGGGNWGSRGTGIAGEATYLAASGLRDNILSLAAILLQDGKERFDIREGVIVGTGDGKARMTLRELAQTVYFRSDLFPKEVQTELVVTRHFAQTAFDGICTNGVQGSYLEIDIETGFVSLLKHWVVHDCGRVINPGLVDAQIRGAVVQGLGAALTENVIYSADAQLLNGTLADYLVPMAAEMPDIEVVHVETPTASSVLGAKGAGESGTAGAPAAVLNALNNALAPFNVFLTQQPFSPDRIVRALREAGYA